MNFDGSNHSAVRLIITLWRDMKRFLLEFYLPSTLFVVCSWGSFFVNPEIVPGRMVLLINLIYALIKMFGTIRNSSPKALEIKCIEVRKSMRITNLLIKVYLCLLLFKRFGYCVACFLFSWFCTNSLLSYSGFDIENVFER